MTNSGLSQPVQDVAFAKLLQEFEQQQCLLRDVVDTVERIGHRISDTNVPQSESNICKETPVLPFNAGALMELYLKLEGNRSLIERLRHHADKINSLI